MKRPLIDRLTWIRFAGVVKALLSSEIGGRASTLIILLILLLLGINGLNVLNSYVGRDFMTAIANRDMVGFVWQAKIYVGVFAASAVVSVCARFIEERLALLWRKWQTGQLVTLYLANRTYYRTKVLGQVDNLDERMTEDVRALTTTTLSFSIMVLNGIITVVAFSKVLWSINPTLFIVAAGYALCGTLLTIILGHRLGDLDSRQSDKEADFRAALIHVRENAESIAMSHHEGRLKSRLLRQIADLAENFRQIVAVNRNLGFFSAGYNYLLQIVPALVVAPMFIRGEIEFGVITQSTIAFAQLVGAFSLIVTQFQSISSFGAVVSRLSALWEVAGFEHKPSAERSEIKVEEQAGAVTYEGLTLRSPENGHPLIKTLSLSIPFGTRVLISGADEAARVALFKASAGLWQRGEGRILLPEPDQIFFLPERPYLPQGTLRQVLVRTGAESLFSDDQLLLTLRLLEVEDVVERVGGLDVEQQDWAEILSLGEQQHLAFARLMLAAPQFAFLDRPTTTLSPDQVGRILKLLSQHSISYVTAGDDVENLDCYDAMLQLTPGGGWVWKLLHVNQDIDAVLDLSGTPPGD
ncbi:ABC transporter ATP-binding protein/permease [Methylotetracoccus oryzae]|uniref:ABC transporter ATP-binding protein/permease n=1 Tax=Methylotetracoccus oryzae TaxID=1919059 RepID=UPI00111A5ED1|nr:SbmA/BacA-like family transporter [Methylotetracoccus oryzae]